MVRSRGFTIIELVVTITVMTILMVLVSFRLVFTERAGRDQERSIDTIALARGLELYYQNGVTDLSIPRGYYPGTTQVQNAKAVSPSFNNFLEGVSQDSFIAPNMTISNSFGTDASLTVGGKSDGKYTNTQLMTLLVTYPYLYQPLKRDNTLCANYTDCVKFNLYYRTESEQPDEVGQPEELKKSYHTITSKNQ